MQNGWNITGDTYIKDADGYFRYQARSDDMIISAGYNIAGPEVETVLLTHPAVAECGVVGQPDDERGQIVKAYVVLDQGFAPDAAMTRGCRITSRLRSRPTNIRARSNTWRTCRAPRPANCSVLNCGDARRKRPPANSPPKRRN